jgi:hypothetical protein
MIELNALNVAKKSAMLNIYDMAVYAAVVGTKMIIIELKI